MVNPPEVAVDNGHDLIWDPPGLSSAQRWTCQICGMAAIRVGLTVYGQALYMKCTLDK